MKIWGPYQDKKSGRNYIIIKKGKKKINKPYARYLMEKYLERSLSNNEEVHHIDEDCTNDLLSNLKVVSTTKHRRHHAPIPTSLREYICPICKSSFLRKKYYVDRKQIREKRAGPFCSNSCARKHQFPI